MKKYVASIIFQLKITVNFVTTLYTCKSWYVSHFHCVDFGCTYILKRKFFSFIQNSRSFLLAFSFLVRFFLGFRGEFSFTKRIIFQSINESNNFPIELVFNWNFTNKCSHLELMMVFVCALIICPIITGP